MKQTKKNRYTNVWTGEENAKLFSLAKSGATLDQILQAFSDRSQTAVTRKMDRMGFSVKRGGEV